jgi:hypothetical protein
MIFSVVTRRGLLRRLRQESAGPREASSSDIFRALVATVIIIAQAIAAASSPVVCACHDFLANASNVRPTMDLTRGTVLVEMLDVVVSAMG